MVARILPFDCLACFGSMCTTCVERCPQPGAITLVDGRPVVNTTACTGCGDCAEACPAPGRAIVLGPEVP